MRTTVKRASVNGDYLPGFQPANYNELDQLVAAFNAKIQIDGMELCVQEHNRPLSRIAGKMIAPAHRYRIAVYLDDEKIDWPRKSGQFLTINEVTQVVDNLGNLLKALKAFKVKKAVERGKRIKRLNDIAGADAAKMAKW